MNNFPQLFDGRYEYLLREVLESIDDAMLVFTNDQKIIYANAAAEDVFSAPDSRLVGQSLDHLIPKDKLMHFTSIVEELKASDHHEVQLQGKNEFVGIRARDHFFYAEGKLAKFDNESACLLVLRDTTWRKAIEGNLEAALIRLRTAGSKVAYRIEHPAILDEFPTE